MHYIANTVTIGAGSAVTSQFGYHAESLTTATNNYGFYSNIASGSNRWSFYAAGSAQNYFAGNVGIGATAPSEPLHVSTAGNAQMLLESTAASGISVASRYKTPTRTWVVGNGPGVGNHTFTIYDETAGTVRFNITDAGNTVAGAAAVLATTATDGFLYVPTCAGTPTGTPTAITGMAPIVVDTTNNKMYFYSGGTWRDAGP